MDRAEFIEMYEYLQGIFSSNPQYSFRIKRKDLPKLDWFLSLDKIGDLWEYLLFSFNRQVFVMHKMELPVIPLRNIISPKAVERWANRQARDTYFSNQFAMKHDLKNPVLKRQGISVSYLDEQRSKNFSTPEGFAHCQTFDGFLFDAEKCAKCHYFYICEELSKKE